jgi:hypothetical protein
MVMKTIPRGDNVAAAGGRWRLALTFVLLACLAMGLCGCAALLSNAAADFADDLAHGITDADDLETVEAGGPAYLLMVDGLIHGNPQNTRLLRAGATLYSAYAGIYVADEQRAQKMTAKARSYALQAACSRRREWCDLAALDFEAFTRAIGAADKTDAPLLYDLGAAWAGWIQARQRDWDAIAQISRVEALMQRVVALDEGHQEGGAHLYLGVLATLLPPAMGGEPEKGRAHFERAIALSNGRNLMAKVSFAKHYGRLVFDRELHDRLLQEVLGASPKAPGQTLMNVLAQQQARELLDSADQYF